MAKLTLVLFDIDGTLLNSGGSGRGAMSKAADELFGRGDMFDDLSFAGAVDSSIVPRAMRLSGIPPNPRRVGRLHGRYIRRLKKGLQSEPGQRCPGVPGIIPRLQEVAEVGLLTGNWRKGAQAKLQALDLWSYFEGYVGAYGGDAMDRNALVPIAYARAKRRHFTVERIVVIGDTPADVFCARAGADVLQPLGVDVLSVGVETGFAEATALESAGPDLQIRDFVSGETALLDLVRG